MASNIFDKKTGSIINVNEQLAEELHKPAIKKSKEEKSMRGLKITLGSRFS